MLVQEAVYYKIGKPQYNTKENKTGVYVELYNKNKDQKEMFYVRLNGKIEDMTAPVKQYLDNKYKLNLKEVF